LDYANDPDEWIARARAITVEIEGHQVAVSDLARERREILEGLLRAGIPQVRIARELDMSRARISQLLTTAPGPERAFLGSGRTLTVAVGGKTEAGRSDGQVCGVVSAEAMAAYERIAELARSLGFTPEYELVPPPGLIQLNRDSLVVLTSPRLLPFVGQVLESDPHLGFGVDDHGWFLVDKATRRQYRSPRDTGGDVDYAYLGRLPRPDGRGSFLYAAGIHGPGTAGAAHYLEQNIGELYRELRTRRWSTLVSCRFDPATHAILSSEPLTPLYRVDTPS
jgi:hypothetical protein